MSLKSAIFEIKEKITSQQVESEETFIHDLEVKNNLNPGTLVGYFNNLMMLSISSFEHGNSSSEDTKKVNRKWTKNEIEFMFHYIKERQEEGALNITEILEEVAQLLNRGYQSVNYKYYNLIKAKDKKEINQKTYHFKTIAYDEVPVLAAEIATETPKSVIPEAPQVMVEEQKDNNDLIDTLSGLITNVQQLPGINLNNLIGSLYQLTNMALKNHDAFQEMESIKTEISHEKEALRESLRIKEQQLIQEKKRNDELQLKLGKLAKEIHAFNKLGDAAKIQNLKSYNKQLNYIIDEFGMVLNVSS